MSDPSRPLAVIADVHGNSDALTAVLADIDAQGVETILNLGDHLSGPLAAAETAEILRSREMIHIRGNHDRWLTERAPEAMGPSDRAARAQLDESHLDWLRSHPPTCTVQGEIFLCHGAPSSDEAYWMETVLPSGEVAMRDRAGIERLSQGVGASLILCAHTHTARALRLSGDRLLVNPGSVGCPAYSDDAPAPHVMQAGAPDARYALVRKAEGRWRVEFRCVPYDPRRMAGLARAAGRDDWAEAVETGWLAAST